MQVPRDADIVTTHESDHDAISRAATTRPSIESGSGAGDSDASKTIRAAGAARARRRRRGARRRPAEPKTLRLRVRPGDGEGDAQRGLRGAEPRRPRWATCRPTSKTILFARNHNLFMMDAANYEKAQKNADDTSIVETQLTTDGEEYYSYAAQRPRAGAGTAAAATAAAGSAGQRRRASSSRSSAETAQDKNARVPRRQRRVVARLEKFSLVRRDERKVKDLWVINALADPRPTLETYRYAMPGEENIVRRRRCTSSTSPRRSGVAVKADRFKDQTSRRSPTTPRARTRGHSAAVRARAAGAAAAAVGAGAAAGQVAERFDRQALLHAAEPRHAQARRLRRRHGDRRGEDRSSRSASTPTSSRSRCAS